MPLRSVDWSARLTCLLLGSLHLSAGLGAASGPAAASGPEAAPSSLEVCIRPNAPFFAADDAGSWGLEHDILAAFAERHGIALTFRRPESFHQMLIDTEQGRCALSTGTITITDERRETMDFSPSYFPVRIVAVERAGATTTRPEQLQGKRAASIAGSTYLKAIESIDDVEVVWVEDSHQMFRAVLKGEADFMACDSAIVLAKIDQYPGAVVTVPMSERDELAFALPKGSPLTPLLTEFMDELKATQRYRELLLRYFDEEGVDLILSN